MTGFVPPPYPYDRLGGLVDLAGAHEGGAVDLSVGTPCDLPSAAVLDALAHAGSPHRYPPSVGTEPLRTSVAAWFDRRLGVGVRPTELAACIGSKEFVAGLPHWLRLRTPERDTVLYPEVSYPSYAMGATLAGCRAVPVAADPQHRLTATSLCRGAATGSSAVAPPKSTASKSSVSAPRMVFSRQMCSAP